MSQTRRTYRGKSLTVEPSCKDEARVGSLCLPPEKAAGPSHCKLLSRLAPDRPAPSPFGPASRPRPEAQAAASNPAEAMLTTGKEIHEFFAASQIPTLAGLRVLDEQGAVIAVRLPMLRKCTRRWRAATQAHLPSRTAGFFLISRGGARLFVAFPVSTRTGSGRHLPFAHTRQRSSPDLRNPLVL